MINLIFVVIAIVLAAITWIGLHLWLQPKKPLAEIFVNTIAFIMLFVYGAIMAFIPIPFIYSDGVKTGTLTKITTKGMIFKTYEGQLNLGGAVSDGSGGMVANTFNFTVRDPKIFAQLQDSQNARVSLEYEEWLRVPKNMGDTNFIITKVR